MLVGNRNENNRELKEYLHLYGITYKMLAEVSGYSCKYLNKIMRRPPVRMVRRYYPSISRPYY